jgi:predicted Fe-S protein YdhL (DUF1289 family)
MTDTLFGTTVTSLSPCIGVCITDAKWHNYCIGCYRWTGEIQNWDTYTNTEKIRINRRILDLKNEDRSNYPKYK